METLQRTPDPFQTYMGWYYRPSTDMYEFWWLGHAPVICLAAVMLEVMPSGIVREITVSVADKPFLSD